MCDCRERCGEKGGMGKSEEGRKEGRKGQGKGEDENRGVGELW